MNKLLSPKNDVVFQKLFGNPKNKHILISFLNSIISKTDNDEIVDVVVEEKKLDVSMLLDEKISVLDIYVTTNKNTHINVEMQLINQYNMTKRTLYYWSKMFLSQLNVGGQYETLNKTITINLLNFNFLDFEKFHSFYHLYEDELKVKLTDIMEIHFIEMKKLHQ
ncbi:MAG: Rpn family recombination-promoting nuclease/putative transposase, partial [Clostridium sp.]